MAGDARLQRPCRGTRTHSAATERSRAWPTCAGPRQNAYGLALSDKAVPCLGRQAYARGAWRPQQPRASSAMHVRASHRARTLLNTDTFSAVATNGPQNRATPNWAPRPAPAMRHLPCRSSLRWPTRRAGTSIACMHCIGYAAQRTCFVGKGRPPRLVLRQSLRRRRRTCSPVQPQRCLYRLALPAPRDRTKVAIMMGKLLL